MAQKLRDAFFIYQGGSIATSGYDLENQVDAKGSCALVVDLTPYALTGTSYAGGVTTLTFATVGDVDITEDAGGITGLHIIDMSTALVSVTAGTYARLLFWDGYAFKEFQFIA